MKKIPTLFVRDMAVQPRLVTPVVTPGLEFVLAGEATPTVKWDGTCCLVRAGRLYKRYDVKHGRAVPPNFEPAQDKDPNTGHWPGWVPVGDGPEDRWHTEGYDVPWLEDGTYELIGPKVQSNPYGRDKHTLRRHGVDKLVSGERNYDAMKAWFENLAEEGVVWWKNGEPVAKLKRRDFGFSWPIRESA